MSHSLKEEQLSDDEVYIGKLSLKEIKKHILWNNHQQNTKFTCASSNDYDVDIKIIETHSAPDLVHPVLASDNITESSTSLSPPGPEVYANWEVKPVDDSFLKVEQMVSDFCMSPKKVVKKDELNNTLDIIDYILKNGAPSTVETVSHDNQRIDESKKSEINEIPKIKLNTPVIELGNATTPSKNVNGLKTESTLIPHSPAYFTPAKHEIKYEKTDKYETPSSNLKVKTPMFKTPSNTLSIKKPSATSLKKTPIKSNAYQHIASPVASYIKNCPIAPLVKDVRPTKPLPGTSSIPKFVKTPAALNKPSNKENVNLPSVAYKSAKKTQLIEVPDEGKLPQTQIMKKITSALPKPLIMKHNHREMNLAKRALCSRQEDSFGDLSLRQADISVCTQKSAFNKPKRPL